MREYTIDSVRIQELIDHEVVSWKHKLDLILSSAAREFGHGLSIRRGREIISDEGITYSVLESVVATVDESVPAYDYVFES